MTATPARQLQPIDYGFEAEPQSIEDELFAEQLMHAVVMPAFRGKIQRIELLDIETDDEHLDGLAGMTRYTYLAEFGTEKGKTKKRVIKVDRPPGTIKSPRARRHHERNFLTQHELEMFYGFDDAADHNLCELVDYEDLGPYGWRGYATVEQYFEGESLDRIVERESGLSFDRTYAIFERILEAFRYLNTDKGILHRDVKNSNFLVNDLGMARVTDVANGQLREELTAKSLPTIGTSETMDPALIDGASIDEHGDIVHEPLYTDQNEVHAIGMSVYKTLTGRQIFKTDPDKRTCVRADTGESVMNPDGTIDPKLQYKAIKDALKRLKGKKARFSNWIKHAVHPDKKRRFQNIDDAIASYGKVDEQTFSESGVSVAKLLGLGIVGGLAVSLASVAGYVGFQERIDTTAKQTYDSVMEDLRTRIVGKPRVYTEWNGENFVVRSNVLEMETEALHREIGSNYEMHMAHPFVLMKPGDRLAVQVDSVEGVWEKGHYLDFLGHIFGHVYFAGFRGVEEFGISLDSFNDAVVSDGMFGYYMPPEIGLPEGMPDGLHYLIIEGMAPRNDDNHFINHSYVEWPEMEQGRVVIGRNRIPVIVGDVPPVGLESLAFDYNTIQLEYEDVTHPQGWFFDEDYRDDLTYEVLIPELGIHTTGGLRSQIHGVWLPGEPQDATVVSVVRCKGEITSVSFVPIGPRKFHGKQLEFYGNDWYYRDITERFAEESATLREKLIDGRLAEETHEAFVTELKSGDPFYARINESDLYIK